MRIGVYGGSFNPIHFGHIGLAKWVVEHTDIDEVWLLVTPNNPLKPSGILADEQERLQAAREATKSIPGIRVSDFEFSLERPSYTANTMQQLCQQYPEHEFTLIIGEDNWNIRHSWRNWEWIEQNFRIFVYPRRSGTDEKQTHTAISTHNESNIIHLEGAPYFDISSTEIREKRKNA